MLLRALANSEMYSTVLELCTVDNWVLYEEDKHVRDTLLPHGLVKLPNKSYLPNQVEIDWIRA